MPATLAVEAVERPNLVLFLLDDARTDDMRYLPRTRRLLGRTGLRFYNAIAENPLCCPARGTLLTGQASHNNGVLTNSSYYGGMRSLRDPDDTLPVWLERAGYRSAFFGKYLNGYDLDTHGIPAGWDDFQALTSGVYSYTDFTVAGNGTPVTYRDDYVTTRMTAQMNAAVRTYARAGDPFFLFDSLVAPHKSQRPGSSKQHPAIPEPKYATAFAGETNPAFAKPSFNEADMSDKPRKMQRWTQESRSKTQAHFLGRIRALASVDDHVESVVDTLRRTGELDDTVIVFTSDNGMSLGEHRLLFKKWGFTENLRVPMYVAGPGFPAGEATPRWVTQTDVTATILDLSGATPGRSQDGTSFASASRTDTARARPLLIQSGDETARSARDFPWSYRGVLFGRYTYARHWPDDVEQLYDSRVDPYQLSSKHEDPAYRGVLRAMRGYYARLRDCRGPGCVLPLAAPPGPRR